MFDYDYTFVSVPEKLELYQRDKYSNNLSFKNINIWTKADEDTGEGERKITTVKAVIWKSKPLSPDTGYLFAREEGAVITFVPRDPSDGNSVFISINKDIETEEKYSLKEVASVYEQMEQILEIQEFRKTGVLRCDYSRPRGHNLEGVLCCAFYCNQRCSEQ